jgi:hypothetical protein
VGSVVSRPAELIVRPQIIEMEWPGDGSFQFIYQAAPGSRYAVDATTNFVNWVGITNITNASVEARVIDPGASQRAFRFYRLRLIP